MKEDELDDFDDVLDLDEIDAMDDFDELDSLNDFSEDELRDIEERESKERKNDEVKFNECFFMHNKTLSHFDAKEDSEKSYFDEIIDFTMGLYDLQSSIYDYQLIDLKYLFARFLYFIRKSRVWGVLELEKDINNETNQLIKSNMCMVLRGYEPSSIEQTMQIRKQWYKRSFLKYGISNAKELLVNRMLQDLELIQKGILFVQSGENETKWIKTCTGIYQDSSLVALSEIELNLLNQEYLDLNKPFRLLDKSELIDLKPRNKKNLQLLLDLFNKKRDAYESIELLTLEDPKDILQRLLDYTSRTRKDGIASLTRESLYESNMLIRHALQKMMFGMTPDDILGFISSYKSEKIALATKHHNETFCILYEREIEFIISALMSMMAGDRPEYIKIKWTCFYPDLSLSLESESSGNDIN